MKYLFYLLMVLNANACLAQKTTKMKAKFNIPNITKDFETIDTTIFKEKTRCDFQEEKKYIVCTSASVGFSKAIYPVNSSFLVVKNYYPNGNIEIKGVRFNKGSDYGIWYKFNNEGEFIEEINVDEGYDFGWDKILDYCSRKEIALTKGYIRPRSGGVHTDIRKIDWEGKKAWELTYYDYKEKQYWRETLDGKTGNSLNKRELKFIGN